MCAHEVILSKVGKTRGQLTCCFLRDVQKAYGTQYGKNDCWKKMWELGVRRKMWRTMKNTTGYICERSAVMLDGEISKNVDILYIFLQGVITLSYSWYTTGTAPPVTLVREYMGSHPTVGGCTSWAKVSDRLSSLSKWGTSSSLDETSARTFRFGTSAYQVEDK